MRIIIELEVQPVTGEADKRLLTTFAYALLRYPEVYAVKAHYDGDGDLVSLFANKKASRRR